MELPFSNIKKFLMIFSKERFSYILGNGHLEKIPYISGNGTFYISANGNPEKILYISVSRTFLYFRRNFQSPKNKIFYISPKNVLNKFF